MLGVTVVSCALLLCFDCVGFSLVVCFGWVVASWLSWVVCGWWFGLRWSWFYLVICMFGVCLLG